MMSQDQVYVDATEMFWKTPELIEKLLPYLNPSSTKCLAEAHDLTEETLLRDSVWNKLLRRTFPCTQNTHWDEAKFVEETLVPSKGPNARALAEILKMAADPKFLQLELMHVICARFPPDEEDFSSSQTQLVRVRCPCNQTHEVAPLGFLLLEEVEAALGSTEQIIEYVQASFWSPLEPLMIALGNRARRQQGREFYVDSGVIEINTLKGAEAFFSLTEHCEMMFFQSVDVSGAMGTEGWAILRQAFELPDRRDPDWAGMLSIGATREAMVGGKRKDLKAIWDAFQDGHIWNVTFDEGEEGNCRNFLIAGGEKEWMRLAETLDGHEEQTKEQDTNKTDGVGEGGSQDV